MKNRIIESLNINRQGIEPNDYYNQIPAIQKLNKLEFKKNITFFVGENGTGKSTLLEAIAVNYGFNPEGGSINFLFSSRDTHSDLHRHLTICKGVKRAEDGFFLRAESFYNVATEIEALADEGNAYGFLKSYGGKSPHKQSHGESFLALLVNRFRGKGLYLLDEPEAAMSPQRQLSMLLRIYELAADSQFIIITHSPILLGIPDADIYSFDEGAIHKVNYEDTESYKVTRLFIENKELVLKQLLH